MIPRAPITLPDGPLARAVSGLGLTLRPERETDVPFLERLYVTVRWMDLGQLDWPEAEKVAFLRQQFAAQYKHYGIAYRECSDFSILAKDGAPIGRLYLFASEEDIRIVDIALLPEWRGRGIGGRLLSAIIEEARLTNRSASIHVEQLNPAQNLYRRLGFRDVHRNGPYILMRWQAGECGLTSMNH